MPELRPARYEWGCPESLARRKHGLDDAINKTLPSSRSSGRVWNRLTAPGTRRKFLLSSTRRLAGAALAATGTDFLASQRLLAQTRLTPDAAFHELLVGNKRFTGGRLSSLQQDLSILRQKTAQKQEPFAAVLSCADSRVPVEIVFDQTIGHIFVTRVAGNVLTP